MKKGNDQWLSVNVTLYDFSKPSETRGKTRHLPAGGPVFQQDDDFFQRDNKNLSRTAIFSGGTTKNSAGRVVAGVLLFVLNLTGFKNLLGLIFAFFVVKIQQKRETSASLFLSRLTASYNGLINGILTILAFSDFPRTFRKTSVPIAA